MRNNIYTKLFGFDKTKHSVKTEITAGITTFLTMAYILAINPLIFSNIKDMNNDAVFTATALAAIIGTLVMSIYAKKPFGLAPGMGLNAFFVFTVCMAMEKTWQFALTAIMLEGIIFILLTVTNIRDLLVKAIPATLKNAIGVGIGLYIAFIGLQHAGIVVNDDATLVSMGSIISAKTILALIGLMIIAILTIKKVKGAMMIGILTTTIIGIFMGETHIKGVMSVPPSVGPTMLQFEWTNILTLDMFTTVCMFLFIDLFDTIGTLVGVSKKTGMVDKDGNIPGLKKAFMADAIATVTGACLGTSTTTTYVESASGVAEGGRTGLTSFVIAICFVVSLFFAPLFTSIPNSATAPVLIIVGMFMISPIKEIEMENYSESIPAFLTIVLMPFCYSISDGILIGIISYALINFLCGNRHKLSPTICILAIIFTLRYIFIEI